MLPPLISELLPDGIIDIHAHFFPEPLFNAIWTFFERHNWPINYKGDPGELAAQLRGFGVRRFTVLNYLHKDGLRDEIAAWTRDFALSQPGAVPFGTLYPGEAGNLDAARRWLDEWNFAGLKIQPLVSKKPIHDPSMYPVFDLMSRRGKWLIVHAGTAPYPNEFTSLDDLEKLLNDFPELNCILAHMGGYDFERALRMLDTFPRLCLDTTMIFVKTFVFNAEYPLPVERLLPHQDRILFGSDFPNIPYDYSDAVNGLIATGLGEEFLKKVFHGNAERILGAD